MRFINILAATLLGLIALAPQQAAAQEKVENPDGIWQHRGSGTMAPRFIGPAERNSITEFNADGSDASAGYSMKNDNGVLILTLYIYPAFDDWTCRQVYDDTKLAMGRYNGATLLDEGMLPSPSGRTDQIAHHARYLLPAGSMQPNYPAMISDIYLHCPKNTNWLVKYRASWTGSSENFPDVPAMLHQVGWGAGLE